MARPDYQLQPNEVFIMKESSVAHGGIWAAYTDELVLTNRRIICVNKGVFGGTKKVFEYPLNQISLYNGKPQAVFGKLSNGIETLDVYFINGGYESFNFQSSNKKIISKWINEISKQFSGNEGFENETEVPDEEDADSVIGAFKEVGKELMDAFGIKAPKKEPTVSPKIERTTKKCMSCSAPLSGVKGQMVHCKYCDTDQVL